MGGAIPKLVHRTFNTCSPGIAALNWVPRTQPYFV